MKIVAVAAAALVLGLLGGTGFGAFRTRAEVLQARSNTAEASSTPAGPTAPGADNGAVPVVVPPDTSTADTTSEAASPSDSAGFVASEQTPQTVAPPDSGSSSFAAAEPEDRPSAPQAAPSSSEASESPTSDATSLGEPVASETETRPSDSSRTATATDSVGARLDPAGAKKLAKIFAAMKPGDAASVLAKMANPEIVVVLLQMNDRQAAPILGALPPARAAALSQAVLTGRGGAS